MVRLGGGYRAGASRNPEEGQTSAGCAKPGPYYEVYESQMSPPLAHEEHHSSDCVYQAYSLERQAYPAKTSQGKRWPASVECVRHQKKAFAVGSVWDTRGIVVFPEGITGSAGWTEDCVDCSELEAWESATESSDRD